MSKASARDRLEQALARIADPAGEGKRACLTVYADAARAAADAADARAKAGKPLGPLDGAIVSIKDLYDVAGEVTRAGSRVLADEGLVAAADAPVVKRLRAAGAVIVAKTNMSEFAFSGVGANPHFGTPGNPFDRARVPGGSTSGGAVAVADGMCEIAIGTDTGGSTRIPAALCGTRRLEAEQAARADRRRVSAVVHARLDRADGEERRRLRAGRCGDGGRGGAHARACVAGRPAARHLARHAVRRCRCNGVGAPGLRRVARLGQAGVRFSDEKISLVDDMVQVNAKGGFAPAEAYAIHRERLKRARREASIRFIRVRIERGGTVPAADYIDMAQTRRRLVQAMDARMARPRCAGAADDADRRADDRRGCGVRRDSAARTRCCLRNTNPVNFFDLCAISLPLPRQNGLSDRADAGRPQRPGPAPVRHRRRGRKSASKADRKCLGPPLALRGRAPLP